MSGGGGADEWHVHTACEERDRERGRVEGEALRLSGCLLCGAVWVGVCTQGCTGGRRRVVVLLVPLASFVEQEFSVVPRCKQCEVALPVLQAWRWQR